MRTVEHHLDVRAFVRETARDDQADVARSEHHDLLAGHDALEVDHVLRGAGGVDACRPSARDAQRPARAFARAHGEDDRLRMDLEHA